MIYLFFLKICPTGWSADCFPRLRNTNEITPLKSVPIIIKQDTDSGCAHKDAYGIRVQPLQKQHDATCDKPIL